MPTAAPRPCTTPGCRDYAKIDGKCEAHKRKAWASNKGKSRHERGYDSNWDKLRILVLERDRYLCKVCENNDRLTKADEVDHIVNKAEGGTDDLKNLQSICKPCHKDKTQLEAQNGR